MYDVIYDPLVTDLTPDPSQLELFDFDSRETETVKNSTDSVDGIQANEPLIRSPTGDMSGNFDTAGSLHRKSRELVKKYFNQKNNENDRNDIHNQG